MFLTFFLSLQVSGPYSLTLHFFRCSAVMSQALAGDVNTTTSFESDEIEVEEVLRPLQVLEDDLELENSSNSLNSSSKSSTQPAATIFLLLVHFVMLFLFNQA